MAQAAGKDKFGFNLGRKRTRAAQMYERGATQAEIETTFGYPMLNMLTEAAKRGHNVYRLDKATYLVAKGEKPSARIMQPGAEEGYLRPTKGGDMRLGYRPITSLRTAPLDLYRQKVRGMPASTEAERSVRQRIGQDIFRDELMIFWSGKCAVTSLDQPELLRASHMKPWARCASDEERLDSFNGLLLAAHWDAAFDKGLVTFDDEGSAHCSSKLTATARMLLGFDDSQGRTPRLSLQPEHNKYLAYHRSHIWRK